MGLDAALLPVVFSRSRNGPFDFERRHHPDLVEVYLQHSQSCVTLELVKRITGEWRELSLPCSYLYITVIAEPTRLGSRPHLQRMSNMDGMPRASSLEPLKAQEGMERCEYCQLGRRPSRMQAESTQPVLPTLARTYELTVLRSTWEFGCVVVSNLCPV